MCKTYYDGNFGNETFCTTDPSEGNTTVDPTHKRPVIRNIDAVSDVNLNKLSKNIRVTNDLIRHGYHVDHHSRGEWLIHGIKHPTEIRCLI